MLTIAMVQTGNYVGRGAEYVAKLADGIDRHMPHGVPYRCVCLTDDPSTLPKGVVAKAVPEGLQGWWNKVALFKQGMFEPGERVLYFDLDTIILGDIADIAAYSGRFAILHDFLNPEHMGSSVMAWEAGALDHIWTTWDKAGRPSFDPRGDQFWIETMQPEADYWQDMLPGAFVSFKRDCWLRGSIPPDARVLCMHGHPRPHECRASFVEALWNRDLLTTAA